MLKSCYYLLGDKYGYSQKDNYKEHLIDLHIVVDNVSGMVCVQIYKDHHDDDYLTTLTQVRNIFRNTFDDYTPRAYQVFGTLVAIYTRMLLRVNSEELQPNIDFIKNHFLFTKNWGGPGIQMFFYALKPSVPKIHTDNPYTVKVNQIVQDIFGLMIRLDGRHVLSLDNYDYDSNDNDAFKDEVARCVNIELEPLYHICSLLNDTDIIKQGAKFIKNVYNYAESLDIMRHVPIFYETVDTSKKYMIDKYVGRYQSKSKMLWW